MGELNVLSGADTVQKREPGIEWMKALGICLVVTGHVIVSPLDYLTFPIHPKQIGVAIFFFVLGWNLAREHRDRWLVIYRRMFPMLFFGIGCILLSGIPHYIATGDVQRSNLLPFLFGVNVFFNYFPANAALWFAGTYFHAILFWVFLGSRLNVRFWQIPILFAFEAAIRALLVAHGLSFTAYMMLPCWIAPFYLGVLMHRQPLRAEFRTGAAAGPVLLIATVAGWALLFGDFSVHSHSFPFEKWPGGAGFSPVLLVSILVTTQYLFYPAILFSIFCRLRSVPVISALARNTLVIFIGHTPLIQALSPRLYQMDGFWLERGILISVCIVGLGLFSEAFIRFIRLPALQEKTWLALLRFRRSAWPQVEGG